MFGMLRKLLLGDEKQEGTSDKLKMTPSQSHPKTEYQKILDESTFYRPDTRTTEQKEAVKLTYLHPKAVDVATGVCAVGQADNERMLSGNDDIITGVKYMGVLDNSCCPECWPLDGKKFPKDINARPPIPRHKDCRCRYLPVTKTWRDFGVDRDELPDDKRPWVLADYQYTYKLDPTKMLKTPRRIIRKHGMFRGTAEEWIRKLPVKEQRPFFPSDLAYELWKTGKITGIDLLDPKTWKLRNDEDLQRI